MYPTGRTDGSVRQNMEVGVVLLILSPNGPSGNLCFLLLLSWTPQGEGWFLKGEYFYQMIQQELL